MKLRSKKGFTLVEIMISVSIVILLFALSINGLLRIRMTANEAAAIKSMRTVHAAFTNFRAVNPYYPPVWTELTEVNPPYLDEGWENGAGNIAFRQGYMFHIKLATENRFLLLVDPKTDGVTGKRKFDMWTDGSIVERESGLDIGATAGGLPD